MIPPRLGGMKIRIEVVGAITFAIIGFAVLPVAQAVSPAPDGGYPGYNTAEGDDALFSLDTSAGIANTAVGWSSLKNDSTGSFNTAVGTGALFLNTAGRNTATGAGALFYNSTGRDNTANGTFALFFNGFFPDVQADNNTAMGTEALFSNRVGSSNTAFGAGALYSNNADSITAVGAGALYSNTAGQFNAALGAGALSTNTLGSFNTAVGYKALENNTGDTNTAIGDQALNFNQSGSGNTAIGHDALFDSSGDGNIAVGENAGSNVTTADGVICIGHFGADVSNTTWIDNIYGVSTQSGTTAQVIVSDTGQLGTVASSERFKKDIATMERASEAILALKPVTFHYKSDSKETPQFGLIAEEVAKVNPALVLPDKEGKPYTVRYDAVNAMLLNEFLKEHRKVEALKSAMAQQRKDFEVVVARLNEQETRIQKVSAQLAVHAENAQQLVENQ